MVYLSLDQRNGSNGLLESFDLGGRSGDQRRASVHNGLTASLTKGQLTANGHSGKYQGFVLDQLTSHYSVAQFMHVQNKSWPS